MSSSVAAKLSKLRVDLIVMSNLGPSTKQTISIPSGRGELSGDIAECVVIASSSELKSN